MSLNSRDELLQRAAIRDRSDPDYVPGECLVHHVRASGRDNFDALFERLYKVLIERVWRSMPKAEGAEGGRRSLAATG